MSMAFEYLHRNSPCFMLIDGGDISYDLSLFFNVCSHLRSFPLHTDWRKSDSLVDGEPQKIGDGIQTPFPSLPPERPGELPRRLVLALKNNLGEVEAS